MNELKCPCCGEKLQGSCCPKKCVLLKDEILWINRDIVRDGVKDCKNCVNTVANECIAVLEKVKEIINGINIGQQKDAA